MAGRFAGIDWATQKHDVIVEDEAGVEVLAGMFTHDERGLTSLCGALVRLDVGLVVVERPDGLLVERLVDAGLRVLPLHPNKVAAAHDRFRVSGGKSDRFDAFVLCELARTDSHRFRVMNQLSSELDRFWPRPLQLIVHAATLRMAGSGLWRPGLWRQDLTTT